MKRALFTGSIAVLLLVISASCSVKPATNAPPTVNNPAPATFTPNATPGPAAPAVAGIGSTAPEFQLKDLKGNTVSLSDFRGKVMLLNFWATW